MSDKTFKVPVEVWKVTASLNGKTYTTTVKSGETATPYYNPKTKKVQFEVIKSNKREIR